MACGCCERWGPKRQDGAEQPPCWGEAKLAEARKWAKIWKARAEEAGWKTPEQLAGIRESIARASAESAASAQRMIDARRASSAGPEDFGGEDYPSTYPTPICPPGATLKEKIAIHLADCIARGRDLIYCQGPERHHAIVGSPMGEQMVERGCFHCDAFPEVQ